ncbi:MAG: hypothetical protein NTX53_08625 [candidate division WOR-3 bacterium]|nr:hypothetical protein [candidate division WOR-3 bacterium]
MRTIALAIVGLLGVALGGPVNDVWNAARPASRGFPGARVTRSLTAAQAQRLATRSRLTRAAWLPAVSQRSSAVHRASGPRLDGEFMVDTAVHYGPAPTQQCDPSVAFDGNNYLVVWTDWRDTLFNTSVLAARVTPDGMVLDTEGIQIDTMGSSASVGFDGTNYLVVDCGAAIQGFRVSPAGEVLDSTAILISSSNGWQQALAFDGTNYLVVWEDYRDSVQQIYGARVTPGGAVLDTAGIVIGTGPHALTCPAITFDGTNFLVVWNDIRDSATAFIRSALVSRAGHVLSYGFVLDSASNLDGLYGPTATSDGTNSLVVWHDFTLGMRGALVDSNGSVVDSSIAIAPPDVGYAGHAALYDGTDYLVAWKAWSPVDCILASRVSRAGVPLDTPGVYVSTPPQAFTDNPAVAFDGNRYFVTWDDDRSGCTNVYGARLTQQMNMLDTNSIGISLGTSRSINTQYGSSVAYDGNNYLVAWTDNRNQAEAIIAARVSPGGANLDPAGIPICTLGFHREYSSVAFDGTSYLVAWADGRRNDNADIYAARVTPGGSVLDPQGIPLVVGGDQHIFPVAAFNGSNYLLVWDDITDSGMCTIRCARVSPAGRVLDTVGVTICSAWSAWMPVVTANGANWLVAWHDWRSESNPGVYAARITSAGQLLDSGGFAVGTADEGEACASLASDGTNSLILWERIDGSMLDVRGARISTTGVLLDSFMVQPAVDSFGTPPSAGFDGTNYGVVWVDSSWGSTWGICGTRISPSGEVIDVTPLASQLAWHTYYPMVSMALGAGSQAFCAYPCWTDEYQGRTYNTNRIWGRIGALSGIQEGAGRLISGPSATIVRGVLELAGDRRPQTGSQAVLLNIAGQRIMDLTPGTNDVSRVSPGVYFVREPGTQAQTSRKVVITR